MSSQEKSQVANVPTFDEKFYSVPHRVYCHVFFRKLASYGIVPESDVESGKYLSAAEIKELDTLLEQSGVLNDKGFNQDLISQVASELKQDPEIYASALALKAAADAAGQDAAGVRGRSEHHHQKDAG